MDLVIEAAALKALLSMPRADAAALRRRLETFAADPHARHPWAKGLGGGTGRIRHGDWPAVYRIEGGRMTVVVLRIGDRKGIYR